MKEIGLFSGKVKGGGDMGPGTVLALVLVAVAFLAAFWWLLRRQVTMSQPKKPTLPAPVEKAGAPEEDRPPAVGGKPAPEAGAEEGETAPGESGKGGGCPPEEPPRTGAVGVAPTAEGTGVSDTGTNAGGAVEQ